MDKLHNEAIKEKEKILAEMNSVILGTVNSKGEPNSSYAPSVIDVDGSMYIYISDLSKHTQNLRDSRCASIMIIEDESNADNLFARKRLTISSDVLEILRDSDAWAQGLDLLEDKFGESIAYLKNLTDFRLFQLTPKSGLLVYGFARAFNFVGKKLDQIKHLNEKGHTEKTT